MANMIKRAKVLAEHMAKNVPRRYWGGDDQDTFKWLINEVESLSQTTKSLPPCEVCGHPVEDIDNVGHECNLHHRCVFGENKYHLR